MLPTIKRDSDDKHDTYHSSNNGNFLIITIVLVKEHSAG